jgi:DNA-binding response OmpR family regulator
MARFKHQHDRTEDRDPSRILIVAHDARRRSWIDKAIKQNDLTCEAADSSAEALMLVQKYEGAAGGSLGDKPFDAVVIDTPVCTPAAMKLMRELGQRQIATLLVCPQVTFEQAVEVMRTGAADIVPADVKPRELCKRLRAALKIDPAATETTAPAAKSDAGVKGATMSSDTKAAGEFARLIQGELDVETLLRHALEFVLARVGPTNAAVFLPGSTGEYALGAYVNLSCPKETAEVMLDHLANTAAPKLESAIGVMDLSSPQTMEKVLGEGAEWLQGQRVLAFACRQENECLAVFVLFREESRPFAADAAQALSMVRDEFGRQLARVIRIHHRHLPRDKWGAPGDGWDSAEDDLAA